MKEEIRTLLEDLLPLVDFDSDFLFAELNSLDVTTILMSLADKYGIRLEARDATLDSIVAMVKQKLQEQERL